MPGAGTAPCRGAEEQGGPEGPGARGQRLTVVWRNVVLMGLLHAGAVYALVLVPRAQPLTLLWGKSARGGRGRLSGAINFCRAMSTSAGSRVGRARGTAGCWCGPGGLHLPGLRGHGPGPS